MRGDVAPAARARTQNQKVLPQGVGVVVVGHPPASPHFRELKIILILHMG